MKEGGCLHSLSDSPYFFSFFFFFRKRSFVSTPGTVNEHLIGVKEEPDVCMSSYSCNSLFLSPSFPIWMLCNPLALSITTGLLVIQRSVNHQEQQIEENSTGNSPWLKTTSTNQTTGIHIKVIHFTRKSQIIVKIVLASLCSILS